MKITSNIQELIEKLERFKTSIVSDTPTAGGQTISGALTGALNAGAGEMKYRIFNKGEDSEGNSLGNYTGSKTKLTRKKLSISSDDEFDEKERKKKKRVIKRLIKNDPDAAYSEYEKERISKGRQIEYKDLEVDGSLRRSIEVVTVNNNRVVVAITNEDSAKIAGYQEQQIGNIRAGLNANTGKAEPAKIFSFSEKEFNKIREEGKAAVTQVINTLWEEI